MTTSPRSAKELAFLKRKWLEKSGTFIAILVLNLAILLMVGGRVIYSFISQTEDVPMTFVKVKKPTPQPVMPHAKGGEAAKSLSDPTPVVVPPNLSLPSIVVSSTSQMNFTPAIPSSPSSSMSLPSFAVPAGSGLGAGTSGGPINQSNPFGDDPKSGVPGLVGELYDLKQTPDGSPTPVAIVPPETTAHISDVWTKLPATEAGLKVLREYVQHWDQDILDRYYKSPKPLKSAQIFIPMKASEEATKAFGVADKVTARRWVIHYHGSILQPTSSQFRFMGYGDDFLVVRVGNRNVLDGSIREEWLDRSANGPQQESVPGPNGHALYCGQWFNTDAGVPISIDILIGEGPGGASGFTLLIEEHGDTSAPGDYPVFQVAPESVPKLSQVTSPFSGKTLVFPAQ